MLGFSATSTGPVAYFGTSGAEPEIPVPTVTGVTVTPPDPVLPGGITQKFSAVAAGENSPPQGMTWSVTLGSVSAGGDLTTPAETDTLQSGTITATSTFDPKKSGSATFTIPAAIVVPPDEPPEEPPAPNAAPRYARPIADLAAGPWMPTSGNNLFALIDEASPNSAGHIYASTPGAASIKLGPVQDPGTSSGQVLRYQAWDETGGAFTMRLKQGPRLIAEWHHVSLPTVPTVFSQALTAGQCDSITDYSDLRFEPVVL